MKLIYVDIKSGKIELTKEEFESFMKEAYDEGYEDGRKETITYLAYPYPNSTPCTPTPSPFVYCQDGKGEVLTRSSGKVTFNDDRSYDIK